MSTIDWITVEGFRSINSIEKLHLNPINILIGPNGSGKSNFIGVFSFLHKIRNGHLRNVVLNAGGANRILHYGVRNTNTLKIHVSFQDGATQYAIQLTPDEQDGLFPSFEMTYFWDKAHYSEPVGIKLDPIGGEAGISQLHNSIGFEEHIRQNLAHLQLYHFHDTSAASPMKKTCDVNDNRYLRPDGSNLASFLYLLRQKHGESYRQIQQTIRLVAPFFEDFQLEPLALNEDKIRLEWMHRGSDAYFDASSLSDGTLRLMGLATLLLQPLHLQPSTIIMDKPELGLHPYAVTLLTSLVKQAAVKKQIILATQSSLLLDHFSPEDVLVANRVNGATEFSRLELERLQIWLDEYSLGQLWEKNEIGGRPAPET